MKNSTHAPWILTLFILACFTLWQVATHAPVSTKRPTLESPGHAIEFAIPGRSSHFEKPIFSQEDFPFVAGEITQIATIDSLLAGVYDGETTLEQLGKCGDFGIGTFQSLDGEMVLLGGVFYQIKADGRVERPPLETTTPFASVFVFPEKTAKINIESTQDYETLCRNIDESFSNVNIPLAVKMEGRFSQVRTRSVPAQEKPYKPLSEITKNQPEFELGTVEGTVVGFRLPPYVRGINVPGYHLHFLTRDRDAGGHLLQLHMERGTVEIAKGHQFRVVLPRDIAEFSQVDLSLDRSEELERVEK